MISVPAIVGAVYFFGDELDRVVRIVQRIEHSILFVLVFISIAVGLKWYITHRKVQKAT